MSLRAIRQFAIHIQTFRNIQLWYQGIYFIKLKLYIEEDKQNTSKRTYAQPIAFTQAHLFNRENGIYDNQIVQSSSIQTFQSAFYTKLFQLRYFQEQVQINDICHFKIQTNIQHTNQQYILQTGLWFYDSYKKQSKQVQFKKQSKCVKTNRYVISPFNGRQRINQYIPVMFEDQYFSLVNMTFHSIIVDYSFRMTQMQLSQFVKLTAQNKKLMMEKLKKQSNNKTCLSDCLKNQLKVKSEKEVYQILDYSILKQINSNFQDFIQQYRSVFSNIITENQIKHYQKQLIYPNQIFQYCQNKQIKNQQQNTKQIFHKNSQYAITELLSQISSASVKISYLWNSYLKLIKINPRFFNSYYQSIYNQKESCFWKKLIKTKAIISNDFCINFKYDFNLQQKQLQNIRKNQRLPHKILNQQFILLKNDLSLMIIQKYSSEQKKSKTLNEQIKNNSIIRQFSSVQKVQSISYQLDKKQKQACFDGIHLVVLVHGFQGSSYDMKLIKNYISVMFPQTMFLCASSNQQLTDSDIFQMGKRLAVQIKSHIIQNFPHNTLGKISFVGHSLGGLKIRAALPRLLQYKDKFKNFITFSSPHLGYKVNSSSVVEAGIWLLQKMKQSQCLKQLSMADNSDPYQTILYKLSLAQGLQHFSNIWLFSSKQDSYAPYQSARIQISQEFMNANDPLKTIHCQMVRNILKNVPIESLKRINVTFTINTKNLDSLIGRTAHIMFLQNSQIIRGLLHYQAKLFA